MIWRLSRQVIVCRVVGLAPLKLEQSGVTVVALLAIMARSVAPLVLAKVATWTPFCWTVSVVPTRTMRMRSPMASVTAGVAAAPRS